MTEGNKKEEVMNMNCDECGMGALCDSRGTCLCLDWPSEEEMEQMKIDNQNENLLHDVLKMIE